MAWTSTHSSSLTDGTGAISLSEVAINDSNKDLVFDDDIGVGSYMQVTQIRLEFIASAEVGTRLLVVQLLESGGDLLYDLILASNSVTAGVTKIWQASLGADTAITTPQFVRLPDGFNIHAGQILRVRDTAAVDAAADDMTIHINGITHK